jgi:SAM-dependent methyltransferase
LEHDEAGTVAPLRARLLRSAFELLYHSRTLYWLASTVPFAGQWRAWQRLALGRLVGHDVLEVGCGLGSLLADMVALGYRCRAVDASPQMVAAARDTLRRRGLDQRDVRVLQARARALPFADGAFDSVVSTFPAPYIHDPAAIRELARVLRPGGRLVVVEGASLLPGNPLLLPLVIFQSLVYGHSLRRALRRRPEPSRDPGAAVQTETLPGRHSPIPLEAAGLARTEQRDRSPLWEAWIVLGEKPPVGAIR